MPLEYPACPLCDATESQPTTLAAEPYRIVRCCGCGHWYLSPRLSEAEMASTYAASDYFAGAGSGYASYAAQESSLRATFRHLLECMQRRGITGRSLLDVGCGYGFLLAEARSSYCERVGTDFSVAAAQHARLAADAVYVGGPESLPPDSQFDVITALHVIEHVYRPRDFVAALTGHLKPGGWLLLAAPDMGSAWRRIMGRRWPSFKYPEHVSFFDRRTLRLLLEGEPRLGQLIRIPYPHAFPLAEVLAKLGVRAPARVAGVDVWIPATTVAWAARRY